MRKLSLDASFVIDFLEGKEETREFFENQSYNKILIPSIAKIESNWLIDDIKKFQELDTIGFSDSEVSEALEIKEFLKEKGEMINKLDIMIAAQAVNSNTVLVTRDKDFDKLEGYEGFKHVNFRRYIEQNG